MASVTEGGEELRWWSGVASSPVSTAQGGECRGWWVLPGVWRSGAGFAGGEDGERRNGVLEACASLNLRRYGVALQRLPAISERRHGGPERGWPNVGSLLRHLQPTFLPHGVAESGQG